MSAAPSGLRQGSASDARPKSEVLLRYLDDILKNELPPPPHNRQSYIEQPTSVYFSTLPSTVKNIKGYPQARGDLVVEASCNVVESERWTPYPMENHLSTTSTGDPCSYHRAIDNILSGKTFRTVQSSLESRGIWSKDAYVMLRSWLLTNPSEIDNDDNIRSRKEWSFFPQHYKLANDLSDAHPSSFREMITLRQDEFRRHMLGSTSMMTKGTEFPVSFFPMVQMVFQEFASQCIIERNPKVVFRAWKKIKECGVILNESSTISLMNTLNAYQTDGDSNAHNVGGEEHKMKQSMQEMAIYLYCLYGASDGTATLLAREMLSQGKTSLAEEALKSCVLTTHNKDDISKAYFDVLEAYCKSNDVEAAVSLFRRLKRRRGVLSFDMHLLLISTLAVNGHLRNDKQCIQIFDELLFSISMKVSKLEYASAKQLYNVLAIGFKAGVQGHVDCTGIYSNLSELFLADDIPLLTGPAKHNEVVAGRVLLDTDTGTCPVTNVKLKLVSLDEDERNELHSDLLDLANKLYAKSPEYKSTDRVERATNELVKFSDWFRKRRSKHFTVIVDGANVGFYMRKKYSKGQFSYRQIQAVVSSLEANGERPLVILPHKYTKPGFIVSDRYRQRLDQDEIEILESLKKDGKLYIVPAGCQDDMYCMIALLGDRDDLEDSTRSNGPNDQLARYPYLITNDRFRDHSLRAKSSFRRLYGCHAVHYKFDRFLGKENCIEVQFMPADLFVPKIQLNKCPSYKTLDESGGMWTGTAWHFPLKNFPANERFVIRLPQMYGSG
ncbi:hypothetical protein HJC23_001770 [Cyclotella cryptica]|uniref:PRORP domain-containing protein n=1 Tax=Cyclotella cryptica TaxID=29204 RepID=A0ABD3QTC5_9STRA